MTGYILALAATVSVLAFGGVVTKAFAPVEALIAIWAVLQFGRAGLPAVSRSTWWILGIIVAIPFLQLIPFPVSIVSTISPARVTFARALFASIDSLVGNVAISVNSYETQIAILRLLCYVLVFLLAFQLCQSRREQPALILLLISLGAFEAVYGTIQYLTGWQYIFTYAKIYYRNEGTGTYINRNHFAGLLEMVLPFLLARILIRKRIHEGSQRRQWKQLIISPHSSSIMRDSVLFAVVALGLVFSRSRMGIFAAMIGIAVVTGIAFLQTRRKSALVLALLILALPVAYSVWIGLAPVTERFESPGAPETYRLPVWRDTMRLIGDYPLFGTGLGTYKLVYAHYQTHTPFYYFEHAHNDYLEFSADLGIPAAVLLFGSIWFLALKVARRGISFKLTKDRILAAGCAGAMVSLLIHGMMDFNLQIPANALIFIWIVGTAAALVREPMEETAR